MSHHGTLEPEMEEDFKCTGGHDLCYGGVARGPECPYCEKIVIPLDKKKKPRTRRESPYTRLHALLDKTDLNTFETLFKDNIGVSAAIRIAMKKFLTTFEDEITKIIHKKQGPTL